MQKASSKIELEVPLSRSLINILLANQADVFLGNLVVFYNILSTVKWEFLCEIKS